MSTNPLDRSIKRRTLLKASLALGALQFAAPIASRAAAVEKKYGPGATDSQIKIGNIMPYSGPASAYAVIGKTEAAFFQMINDEGGIKGRKITLYRTTMATVRQRRSSRRGSWLKTTTCC